MLFNERQRPDNRKVGVIMLWYLKQLLPLTYWTTYEQQSTEPNSKPEKHFTIWRMWFGRCFNVIDIIV